MSVEIKAIDFEQLYQRVCHEANQNAWVSSSRLRRMICKIFGEEMPNELVFEIIGVMVSLGMLKECVLIEALWYRLCPQQ